MFEVESNQGVSLSSRLITDYSMDKEDVLKYVKGTIELIEHDFIHSQFYPSSLTINTILGSRCTKFEEGQKDFNTVRRMNERMLNLVNDHLGKSLRYKKDLLSIHIDYINEEIQLKIKE